MQYKIKESKEDVRDSVIEKTGHIIEFSMNDITRTQTYNAKTLKELKATLELKKGEMSNIEEHHPFVKDFSDEQLFTIAMYQKSKSVAKEAEKKIKEFETAEKELNEELEEIYKQIPEVKPLSINLDDLNA